MTFKTYQLDNLRCIEDIIRQAARANMIHSFKQSTSDIKADGSIVTDADLAMQQSLESALLEKYPSVKMLSEEIAPQLQAKAMASGHDYWCLDPLDGTTNYHATLPLFSVSLALVSHQQVVLGVVYDPIRDESFSALKEQGFWINGAKSVRSPQPEQLNQSIAFVDFKRLNRDDRLRMVDHAPYKSQRNIGTCALEWAWLAAGRAHLLIHGSENLWDYAAGDFLLNESGGISQNHQGKTVFAESLEPRSVLAASTPSLFELWSNWFHHR